MAGAEWQETGRGPEKATIAKQAPRENTYLDSQVVRALQKPAIDNTGEVVLHGKRRYTIERAKKELGSPSFKVWMKWRRHCDVIGKGIKVYPSIPGVCPSKTCSAEQIDRVKRLLTDARAGRFHHRFRGKMEVWISWEIAKRYLTLGNAILVRRTYLYGRWHKRGCPHLDGKNLRIRCFDFSKENWFLEAQITQIGRALAAKESRKLGRSIESWEIGVTPVPVRKPRRPAPIVTFSGIFEESDGKRYTIQAASKTTRISEVTLYAYLKGIPPGSPLYGLFADNRLPTQTRLIPGTKRQRLPTIHERDLDIIEKAWHEAYDEAERVARLPREKSANQICDLRGIKRRGDRILVHNLLVDTLPGAPAKRAAGGPRGYTPTVLYNLDQLDAFLNGRDLLDVAKIHAAGQLDFVGHARTVEPLQGGPVDNTLPGLAQETVSGPLGIRLFPTEHKAERQGVTVFFRQWTIPWKIFELLCGRHPAYYREVELGHDSCNAENKDDDPGIASVWNHVSRIRKVVKKLKINIENMRGLGYRIEPRKRKR